LRSEHIGEIRVGQDKMSNPEEKHKTPSTAPQNGGFRFSPKKGDSRPAIPPRLTDTNTRSPLDEFLNDKEFETPKAKKPKSPLPPIGDPSESREKRLPCNFPGLMRVLIPENSFLPVSMPVRVVNLSATGAMVEVHDKARLDHDIALANRFYELKVAHPDIPTLRGCIAWSDTNRDLPLLGLSHFKPMEELGELILAGESTRGFTGPPPLPAPVIDPYPPLSDHPILTITGKAPEALEVIAKGEENKFTAPVVQGRFELKLELSEVSENHFSLRSLAGTRKSRSVPIRAVYNSSVRNYRRGKHFDLSISKDEDGNHVMAMDFSGNVQSAERILFRFSQLMTTSQRISIVAQLASPSKYDKRIYDALQSEGIMISSDTTTSREATRLLNELL
jgi:hypothetical protein